MLVHPARSDTFLVPDVGDPALLPDPGLVHKPELDPLGLGVPGRHLAHHVGQSF